MPRCQWIIEKGSRKNEECGIYTKKENDGKYYCSSHLKMAEKTENEDKPIKLKKTKTTKKIIKKIPKKKEETISESKSSSEDDFDNGEIIEEIKDKTVISPIEKTLEEKIEDDYKKILEEKEKKRNSKTVSREEFVKLKKKVVNLYYLFVKLTGSGSSTVKDDETELETFN